jgi:hypothetical protein
VRGCGRESGREGINREREIWGEGERDRKRESKREREKEIEGRGVEREIGGEKKKESIM